ncbi:MAG: carbonate dehydratase [Methylococcales symbiont of Hymedesmia sp. n. MRB-2018]|nr:MAG: carbonate dehydratase [Methylococcales symbiont of Hymedesmia sp. n. MRB-2018]KAF3983313.1 MAG: carbonate dehydratase [Methylococcales symbiont of Hymedesmia sp. n. MRB-2018]
MKYLKKLYENNIEWAKRINQERPTFFSDLSKQQSPDYLWIGCSDSRVVSEQLVGLQPGELFVHRNIANVVVPTDLNCLSVIQYAVEILKVKHIIVCGHYGCGGVLASMQSIEHGLIDNWLCHIKNVHQKHQHELQEYSDETERLDRLCELNVIEQVKNICHTTVVQRAWRNSKEISVHGCIYTLETGILKDLNVRYSQMQDLNDIFQLRKAKKNVYKANITVMETDYEGR